MSSGRSKLERTKMRMLCTMPNSTDRTLQPWAERGEFKHFLERDLVHAWGLVHDGGSGVDTVDVGIDVAALRWIATAIATGRTEPPRPSVVMRPVSLCSPWSRRYRDLLGSLKRLISSSPFRVMMRPSHARCR